MEEGSPLSSPQLTSLDYATPGSDARVLYTREGDRATVVIRRPERRGKAAVNAAADATGQVIFYLIVAGVFLFWTRPIWFWVLIPAGLTLFGLIYGVAWLCLARLARPIVIEMTESELQVRNLDGSRRNLHLNLDGLYAVYTVSHSQGIWIRRHGKEMAGFTPTPDAAENDRIAAFLREAAGLAGGESE